MVRFNDQGDGEVRLSADPPFECVDPEIGELLPFHADGTIGANDRQLLLAHLAACARCAEEERSMRDVARGIAGLRLDPDRRAAVEPSPGRWRTWLVAASIAAAAAALLLGLAGSWPRAQGGEVGRAEVVALEQRMHQLETRNALLAHQVAREQARIESPLAGIPVASPPNF